MNFLLSQIFGYSILIAALIGFVRFGKISKVYSPFIFLLWVGLANEIYSTIIIIQHQSNAINNNIYVLIESVLILLLFRQWGLFDKSRYLFWIILIFFTGVWITENFIISKINRFSSYFRILYSFAIVLMSVSKINRLMVEEKRWVERRGVFLLLIGFIVFFTYKSLIEIFWVYGLNASRDFRLSVYRIMTYINLSVNLMFAIALLWIPRKRESLLR